MAAVLAGFTEEQTASVQEFITGLIDTRMEIAGRAATFINELDQRQRATIEQINVEMGRMNMQVVTVNQAMSDMNVLKTAIEKTHATVIEITAGTSSFADSTRAEFEATSLANKEAHQ